MLFLDYPTRKQAGHEHVGSHLVRARRAVPARLHLAPNVSLSLGDSVSRLGLCRTDGVLAFLPGGGCLNLGLPPPPPPPPIKLVGIFNLSLGSNTGCTGRVYFTSSSSRTVFKWRMNAVRRPQRPPQSCQFGLCSIATTSVIAFWYSILSMLTPMLDHSRLLRAT